jgi:hypothetical protein
MEDFEPDEYSRFGHNVDPTQIRLEAYRLAAMFLSAGPIAEISLEARRTGKGMVDSDTHWLEQLRSQFFWNEASRILTYIAIQARIWFQMKVGPLKGEQIRSDPIWKAACGHLEERATKEDVPLGEGPIGGETKPLTLKDAFDKIIHADVMNPDLEAICVADLFAPKKINALLYLYGKHMGRAWRATIDVIEFVRLVRRAFPE